VANVLRVHVLPHAAARLEIEDIAGKARARGQHNAFGTTSGNGDVGGKVPRAISDVRRVEPFNACHARVVHIARARSRPRSLGHALVLAVVEREHLVGAGLSPPVIDELAQPLRMLAGEIMALREVLVSVVACGDYLTGFPGPARGS